MNIINAENLTKSYTERKLLDKASFYLQEGEKVGVIGINGTGKSTLLKIIAGLEEPDEGQVTCANHIVVRYLPQNPVFDPEMTVLDSVLTQCVLNFVGSGRTERTDADAHAQEQKWSLESDAKSMMTRLGITDFTQKTGELSGGQRKRLALVAALLVPCDVLILDEPTNHLDSAMADWLEKFYSHQERKGIKRIDKLRSIIKVINQYGKSTRMGDIDKKWALGFIDWLQHTYKGRQEKLLEQGTVVAYILSLIHI